jgi:hypothetical protein
LIFACGSPVFPEWLIEKYFLSLLHIFFIIVKNQLVIVSARTYFWTLYSVSLSVYLFYVPPGCFGHYNFSRFWNQIVWCLWFCSFCSRSLCLFMVFYASFQILGLFCLFKLENVNWTSIELLFWIGRWFWILLSF